MSSPPDEEAAEAPSGSFPADGRSKILGGASRGRRRTVVTLLSCLAVFGGMALLIVRSPGWPRFKALFLDPQVFFESLPEIARFFGLNIFMFIVAEAIVLVAGLGIATLRGMHGPAATPFRWMAIAYIDFFRGVPVILVVLVLGFGMPALRLSGLPDSDIFWGIIALSLCYSAYVAEVYRAGIESIHPSQVAAARSLGLSKRVTFLHVVFPQAVRNIFPPLLNDFISLQKDTALVSILGTVEAMRTAQVINQGDFNFTPFFAVALLFLLVTVPLTRTSDWLTERQRRRQQAGGG